MDKRVYHMIITATSSDSDELTVGEPLDKLDRLLHIPVMKHSSVQDSSYKRPHEAAEAHHDQL
jgi:hypothetical protein